MNMMKAIVVEQSGSPEVLHIRQIHRPEPDNGWVVVRIRAFGLNRSEMFTRQGFSPDVTFPRILGIEAVGEVEQDPSGHYPAGQKVGTIFPKGVDRIQELVGTRTLLDSLQATAPKGVVCMTGMLGNAWSLANFEPMMIPSSVKLTTYQSETLDMSTAVSALQEYVTGVEHGTYTVRLDRVFKFDEIVEAHRYMESNAATGKLVVLVD